MPAARARRPPPALRWMSPAMFGVVLISLALPFASVSCRAGEENLELARLRGYHLVTGSGPEVSPVVARATEEEQFATAADIGPQPFAVLAMVAAIAGLVAGFGGLRFALVPIGAAVVGGASVVLSFVRLESELAGVIAGQPDAGGVPEVRPELGYWVALVAFALALTSAAGLVLWARRRVQRRNARGRSRS